MNSGTTVTGFRKYSMGVVLVGLGLMAGASVAVAQNTLSAGNVSAAAGGSAVVPITITLGSGVTVADLSVTFSAVPQGVETAVTGKLTFQPLAPLSSPDLTDNSSVAGAIAIGWVNDELTLTGTVQIGTVTVPIPTTAVAGTYQLTLSHVGALDPSDNDISSTFTAGSGTITVTGGSPTATPTLAPTTNTLSAGSVSAAAGTSAVVPITIALLSGVTVADLSVTFSAVPQGGETAVTDKLTFQPLAPLSSPDLTDNSSVPGAIAIGWVNDELSLTGTVQIGTVTVPIPTGAVTGTYELTLSHVGALDPSDNDISSTFTAESGTITVGTPTTPGVTPTTPGVTPTTPIVTPTTPAVPTATATTVPTATATHAPTATLTATKPPATATPSATPTPQQTSVCPACPVDDDGCQIGARGHTAPWLLLIPAIGLLVVRRRRR